MKRINLLDTDTSNKISAGEVIERPFSAVKELVENSIDADAKNIIVEIQDGGQSKIKVSDDGRGIFPQDIEKAFLPHATSKINVVDDIYKLTTMGFRGEALASIAAVSKVKMISRYNECDFGREISITAGKINNIRDSGCNIGTSVEVEDLFFNVPARHKFMKSIQSETSAISDIMGRLALANPEISFKYINNGKNNLNTFGTGNILDALRSVYGKTINDNVIPFERHLDEVSIYGYVGNAEISRGSRNNQSVFVNKRYIKSRIVTAAVENAFKSFITINKFPFYVVYIDIFPEYIDVNVHPTKSEVKFRDEREIYKNVFDAVHEALMNYAKQSFMAEDISMDIDKDKHISSEEVIREEIVQLPIDLKNNDYKSYDYKNIEIVNNKNCEDITYNAKLPDLIPIGSLNNTYILAQGPEGLYIVDQHAAHEKVMFERLKKEIEHGKVIAQVLISPSVIELNSDDYSCYMENVDIFKNAGFSIEIFGDRTISIREVPMLLGKPDIDHLFHEMIDNIKNLGHGETVEVKYMNIARLACRSAVKANDILSLEEMKRLLDDMKYLDEPFTCPHGRPTIIKITTNDLEKRFKRIQ